jgi:hypothetical protein
VLTPDVIKHADNIINAINHKIAADESSSITTPHLPVPPPNPTDSQSRPPETRWNRQFAWTIEFWD